VPSILVRALGIHEPGKEIMERRLIRATEISTESVGWLWPGRIPYRAITLLEGPPGVSKSVLTYDLTGRVTSGRPMPGESETKPAAGVVLLQAEDSISGVVLPNLRASGADLSNVVLLDKHRFLSRPFNLPTDLSLVEEAVKDVHARLLVIDPFTAFVEANTNNDVAIRRVLGPLLELAERNDVAVLVVRHLRKSGARHSLYGGAGSIGIIAIARSSLLIGRDPGNESKYRHILALNKGNLADAASLSFQTVKHLDGEITVEWLGESQYSADDINEADNSTSEYTALQEAMYVLYAILSEGSVPASDVIRIAKKAGVSERTLKRAKRSLRIKSIKKGSSYDSRWFWMLPEDDTLLQPLKEKDLGELIDRLIYGDSDLAPRLSNYPVRKKEGKSEDNDSGQAIY
jgi:hypothetical protein